MHAFPFDFQFGEDVLHGLFVDRASHIGYAELADELYNRYRGDLSVATIVVIRPPVDQPLNPNSIQMDQLRPLFERLPHVSLHLLASYEFQHFVTANLNSGIQGIVKPEMLDGLLRELQQFELRHYAVDANALLRATGTRVFRAPSGKYCRSFIRVGSVQIHRAALDGFFFWLLPWLKECHAIVTETWTISSIALNACRLLERYARASHSQCEVDMLSEYHDGSSELVPDTVAVLRRAVTSGNQKVLILISSTMSGTLVARIEETIDRLGLPSSRFDFGALYNLGVGHAVRALCDISNGINGGTFECFDSPPPDAGTPPEIIDIDKRTYFPLRIQERTVLIRKHSADPSYGFFSDYRNSGLISVHRDSFLLNGQRFRHHAIFTDVLKILEKSPFKERFEAKLTLLESCPALILTPPHPAGLAMAEQAQSLLSVRFGSRIPAFQHLDLNLTDAADESAETLRSILQNLKEADSILVIDDVSVTGRRLSRYQLSLRELGYIGRIHYLVGVGRPEKRADWESRVRRLRLRQPKGMPQHTLECVEFVVLPDWDENHCPWCRERDIYRRLTTKYRRVPLTLAARAHRLQRGQTAEPLEKEIFFKLPGEAEMRLTPNSIFLPEPATEADVFAAAASALEEMRTNPSNPDHLALTYPEIPVLHIDNYLGAQFNDSVIRAAILRASFRPELECPDARSEDQRHERMTEILLSNARDINNLTLELLLAMAVHKLPKLSLSKEQRAIINPRGYGELIDLLHSAAAENL